MEVKELELRREEVLRYLGHRGQPLDGQTEALVDKAMETALSLARPQWTCRTFSLDRKEKELAVEGTGITLTGESIAAHLEGAEQCVLLAATLGVEVEARIRALEARELTAALALDAAATALVESVCDRACEEIGAEAGNRSQCAGSRFSPGYGDLPLALQPAILRLLDAERRIGLTCTENLILLPRKSVTAIAGLFKAPVEREADRCAACPLGGQCAYRRRNDGTGREETDCERE